MADPTPPAVWWSPSHAYGPDSGLIEEHRGQLYVVASTSETGWASLAALPVDAVRLVPDTGQVPRGECPEQARHRGPEGPNEDLSQCRHCWAISWQMRPEGETYGEHLPDCSLPERHESYCQPGGSGHQPARKVRGYFGPAWPPPPATAQAPDVAASAPGILHMAMRYALGRATYAVFEVCDAIKAHAAELAPGTRERMAREIGDALRDGGGGMDMDVARWADARRVLLGADTTPEGEQ